MEEKNTAFAALAVSLILALCFSLYGLWVIGSQATQIEKTVENSTNEIGLLKEYFGEPAGKGIKIQVTKLMADCNECYDVNTLVDSLKQLEGINITKEKTLEFNSEEEKTLVEKYGIKKLPVIVITGDINDKNLLDAWQNIGDINEGILVQTNVPAPYYDIVSREVRGKVSLILIESSKCEKCTDIKQFGAQLEGMQVFVEEEQSFDYGKGEGKEIIAKYGIERIPAIIISKEIDEYPYLAEQLKQVATTEADGSYVWRDIVPPYFDLNSMQIKGLVGLTMLVDASCADCYDVNMQKTILENYGMKFSSEQTIDVSSAEGKSLVEKYEIKGVPTVILSSEASLYTALAEAWLEVGTIEGDGSFIFRDLNVLGVKYKDLS